MNFSIGKNLLGALFVALLLNACGGGSSSGTPSASADTAAPASPTVTISAGAASTVSTVVTLDFSATDNVGVTAYFTSETVTAPAANDMGWTAVTPAANYAATVNFTLSSGILGNNTKTVYVWFKDAAGNVSVSANDAITLVVSDTIAPASPTISINTAAASTPSTAVTLALSATDSVGVSAYFASEIAGMPLATDAGWTVVTPATNYSATVNFTLSSGVLGNNTKTVYIWFKDAAGNVSASANDDINLIVSDTTAPASPTVSINTGVASTPSTAVTLGLTASDSVGVSAYFASETAATPLATDAGWMAVTPATNYTATVSFTLSSGVVGNNTKTVYVWFKDAAGNVSAQASDAITLIVSDAASPSTPSISINTAAASTTSTVVSLALSATDTVGVTAYFASVTAATPAATDAGWTAVTPATNYTASVSFTLSAGAVGNNTKTVYVWFKDAAGNVSASASDAITLVVSDTTAPGSPTVAINTAAASTPSTAVTLAVSATDNVGVTAYFASETAATPAANDAGWTAVTPATNYTATVSFTLSAGVVGNNTKTVYVWFKDAAGNVSASANDDINLIVSDTTAPASPTVSINTGVASTPSTAVTLGLTASDSVGVSAYFASETAATPLATDAGWTAVTPTTNYTASVNFTLSAGAVGNNTKTVYVWFKDAAGNVSALANDIITLVVSDATAPTSPSASINTAAASTTSTAITLAVSATDSVGVTAYFASETAATPAANDAGWTVVTPTTNYSASVAFTLSAGAVGNNTKTVYVWFKDAAGNVSAVASDGITLVVTDGLLPNINSFSINGFSINTVPGSTTSTAVTLGLSASDSVGVTAYFASENAATPLANDAGWIAVTPATNYTASVSFTLSAGAVGNNTKTVYVWFKDAAGNMAGPASLAITLIVSDATAPASPFVSINTAAATTPSTAVTLALSATDNVGVSAYFASETAATPLATDAGWTAVTPATNYAASVSFTLSAGVVGNNTKTVYVWFKDAAGNVSAQASDAITLVVSASTYSIGGTLSGLTGSVTLHNNGGDPLTLSANGVFTFITPLSPANTYSVTVASATQNCAVTAAGTGTVSAANVTNVTVACGPGTFLGANGMSFGHLGHTATLLPDGRVLVVAGDDPIQVNAGSQGYGAVELYDPATGFWQGTNNLQNPVQGHTATLLANGTVLVTGGVTPANNNNVIPIPAYVLTTAERFNPATETWAVTAPMATARHQHTATLLPNGKVLVTGGLDGGDVALASAELYDPTTNTWGTVPAMGSARYAHAATLLPNGKVLVFGAASVASTSAELYDPATNTWAAATPLSTARLAGGITITTATLLADGRVLVSSSNTSIIEIYNSATNTWTAAAPAAFSSPTLTLLPNGQVLAKSATIAKLYDPIANTWTSAGSGLPASSRATATLLANGHVLYCGGSGVGVASSAALLYW